MDGRHWQDWFVTLIGIWLVVSHWALDIAAPEGISAALATVALWNAIVSGVVAIALGVAATAAFKAWEEWASIALGLWLVVSPWLLGYAAMQTATWNVTISGVLIILSAAWAMYDERQAGHA